MLVIPNLVKNEASSQFKKNDTLNGIRGVLESCNLDLLNDKGNYQNINYLNQHLINILSTENLAPKNLSLSNL